MAPDEGRKARNSTKGAATYGTGRAVNKSYINKEQCFPSEQRGLEDGERKGPRESEKPDLGREFNKRAGEEVLTTKQKKRRDAKL